MGVDAKWGRFPICPEMSCFVPVCLSSFVLLGARNDDKSGQTRTTGNKTGDFGTKGKRPHLASTPI